ncbi:nuclear transport factor 2 family protein, partial [Anaplasma marginale]|uniref:nuclear transport factor 2 family protein n=1 Tax=Anaplasma marginale TaxID=770 RepID=UPI0005B4B2B1
DREDYNEYLTYFARNFNFDPGFGEPMSDRTSVRGFLEQNQKSGFIVGKRHVMSNLMMSRSGNRIIAQYYLSVFEREKAPAIVATAFIVDEFERENGEWRVVRHITAVDPALFNVMDKQN